MTQKQYPIDKVDPNPWQTRTEEDPAHVGMIARSIADVGLLQIPIARMHPEDKTRVQLAFGMTRLAAYKMLHDGAIDGADPESYATFPVDVLKMDDRELAELAIRENRDRQDLTPIEEAQAMHQLIDSFGFTTTEIAELWGYKGPSSVRTKLRLLSLPKKIQAHLQSGAMPERVGRRLIGISNANPSAAEQVADEIVKEGKENTPADIEHKIKWRLESVARQLCSRWQKNQVEGDLWHITAAMDIDNVSDPNLRDALSLYFDDPKLAKATAKQIAVRLAEGLNDEAQAEQFKENPEAVRRIQHLLTPPACALCPYHHSFDGSHYCTFDPCFKTKKMNYHAQQVAKARRSRKLKAWKWYDKATDGKKITEDNHYYPNIPNDHEDIRLYARGSANNRRWQKDHPLADFPFVGFCVVGKSAEDVQKKRESRETDTYDYEAARKERERRSTLLQSLADLLHEPFTELFADVTDWKMLDLTLRIIDAGSWQTQLPDFSEMKPKERTIEAQKFLGWLLTTDVVLDFDRAEPFEKWIQKVKGEAKRYGVKLPRNWSAKWLATTKENETDENKN